MDKGTFDAIALSDDKSARAKYVKSVRSLVEPHGGLFLITSCNFTERVSASPLFSVCAYE